MGHISDILGVPPEVNKPGLRKAAAERTSRKSETGSNEKDKLEISSLGRELLSMKAEASKSAYMEHVRSAETLDEKRLELIRERIKANFYNDPHVIEKILAELMELPYFGDETQSPFENK